jgi:hypothetical protein
MYLVELRPGKEELYRTGDELAAAIRNGDVDVHSRIYHRATSKWISVTLHPQYKAIVSERPPDPPMPPLERSTWTFFNDSADSLAGANDPDPEPEAEQHDEGDSSHPWRRPLALSITGGLLILGLQLAASGPRPPWSGSEHKAAPASQVLPASAPVAPPAGVTISLASNGTNWVADEQAYIPAGTGSERDRPAVVPAAPETDAASLPSAPKMRTKMLLRDVMAKRADTTSTRASTVPARAMSALIHGWAAAHDSARVRLESGMRVARLNQLFATGRLTPGGGVTETRMSLAGVANFVRVYRQQETAIERQYQDSFAVVSKQQRWTPAQVREWYAKPSAKESPTLIALTSTMLEGIDSVFGVLDAQAGTYTVTKNTIRFEDPSAAREYTVLRQQILATMEAAKAAGGADQPGPMSYLLQAIGATRLPVAI